MKACDWMKEVAADRTAETVEENEETLVTSSAEPKDREEEKKRPTDEETRNQEHRDTDVVQVWMPVGPECLGSNARSGSRVMCATREVPYCDITVRVRNPH